MASSRVKASTTIALSVIEDVLTLATTMVASSIAFSMRSIGFVLLKSPHVVPVFKMGARERDQLGGVCVCVYLLQRGHKGLPL